METPIFYLLPQAGAAAVASEPVADNLLDNLAATGVSVLKPLTMTVKRFCSCRCGSHKLAGCGRSFGSVGKNYREMLRRGIGATRRVHATAGNHNNLIVPPHTFTFYSRDTEVRA